MTLWHNIVYMAKPFIIALDITAMISILQEQSRVLHDKMLVRGNSIALISQ